MEKTEKQVLNIQMFGKFMLTYQGEEYTIGRNAAGKFVQLLLLVWLQGEKGISREHLMRTLYDREEILNLNNSFNNLLYQLKKQIHRSGLPEGKYIVKKNNRYMSGADILLNIDAVEFVQLLENSKMENDEGERCRICMQALELYKGELLPAISTEIWVVAESIRLKALFEESVRWVGDYLKKQREYQKAYGLYSRAAELYPFDEWQVEQIEVLISMEEFKEAFVLYNKTVHLYSEEIGILPSERLLRSYEAMSEQMEYAPGNMEEIKAIIQGSASPELEDREEAGDKTAGAYYCSYPGFLDVFHMLRRNMERTGFSVYLMLCTLVDYEGKMIQNQDKLKKRSASLKEAIESTLREGDAYTKYSSSQYLILLVCLKQEDCANVYRRISKTLKEIAGPRAELRYDEVSLAELSK